MILSPASSTALGGDLQDVFISELRDHTYFRQAPHPHQWEARRGRQPAQRRYIALAVTANVPIYVAEDVLGEVCGE